MTETSELRQGPGRTSSNSVLFLLDCQPSMWTSLNEMQAKLCCALRARHILPVMVFSGDFPDEIRNRFESSGAVVAISNYGKGKLNYHREIGALVQKYRPDTVHVGHFDYFSFVPWIARLQGVRYAIFAQENSGVLGAKSWKKLLIQLRARIMTQPITQAIARSEYIRGQMIESGMPADKIKVVYNGIDTERFIPNAGAREQWIERYGIQPNEVILTSIAFLRPFKNPQVIVGALSQLVERGIPARLFMVGDGDMRPQLEELSRELGVSKRIHWLGNFPNPESLLQASDIFVLASVGEAFGLVLAEALACGVPVVASRSGAIGEVVEDGRTGLLATPRDASSFADAIERLARDAPLRREMGIRGRESVKRKFTTDIAVENTLRLYDAAWSRPRRKGH
jgi:glycosyltransferase involved in cell wall biosynthesis